MRDYKVDATKNVKFTSSYMLFTLFNIIVGYFVVKYLNLRFESLPMSDELFLVMLFLAVSYNFLTFLILHDLVVRTDSMLELMHVKNVNKLKFKDLKRRIKLIMKLWNKVNDAVMSFNKIYSFNLMLSLTNFSFLFLIINFYLYDFIVRQLAINEIFLVLGGYSYSLLTGSCFFAIIKYSSHIKKLHENAGRALCDIGALFKNRKVFKLVHLSHLQLDNAQKEISCGIYAIKWNFIFIFITSFFDYTLVMIQFDNMVTNNQLKV
jgi:hypothetical protein